MPLPRRPELTASILLTFTAFITRWPFSQNDTAGMQQEVAWATGKTGLEDVLLGAEASTSAYFGRMQKSREFSRLAVASAERADEKETAATYEADEAVAEALFGNRVEARNQATAALRLSTGGDVQYAAALARALAEDSAGAVALVDDLVKRFPENTIIQLNYSPTVHAQASLNMKDTAKAFNALQISAPYELGSVSAALLQSVSGLRPWASLSGRASRQRSRRRVPEDSRSSRRGFERSYRPARSSRNRTRIRIAGGHFQGAGRL